MNRASLPAERAALLASLGASALVAGALGFQYLAGIAPCEMCHWQRWPYFAAALAGFGVMPLIKRGKTAIAAALVVLAVILGLAAAYQWGMLAGWQPKALAAATIALLGLTLWKKDTSMLAIAVIGLVVLSGLIGAYQTGMQWHILPGPSACTVDHPYIMGSNAPPPAVRCDVPNWLLFGLSLAAYNAIFAVLIAGMAAFLLGRRK